MTELTMLSWKHGLQTVSLIKAVKQYSTGSLVKAKGEIERLLAGEAVVLSFASEALRNEFQAKAESYGVVFLLG
ncbi:hypothetical protein GCM10007907_01630 [Chitinimonas prasina]|uniref:Uncharacterized protein n=1 Tax=Chitinimonas prasina TaxID=1434937 RepID=A0ABQ5YBH7_9NEIS|nr:hypothetical protein [Chitinimonas prasina]GLR11373.1 hypothetical protein GCM10007907_01630 [Chitinimonas prasina]